MKCNRKESKKRKWDETCDHHQASTSRELAWLRIPGWMILIILKLGWRARHSGWRARTYFSKAFAVLWETKQSLALNILDLVKVVNQWFISVWRHVLACASSHIHTCVWPGNGVGPTLWSFEQTPLDLMHHAYASQVSVSKDIPRCDSMLLRSGLTRERNLDREAAASLLTKLLYDNFKSILRRMNSDRERDLIMALWRMMQRWVLHGYLRCLVMRPGKLCFCTRLRLQSRLRCAKGLEMEEESPTTLPCPLAFYLLVNSCCGHDNRARAAAATGGNVARIYFNSNWNPRLQCIDGPQHVRPVTTSLPHAWSSSNFDGNRGLQICCQ